MPTYKISQLTTATAVSATNQFEINQNGTSKSVEVSVIDAYIKSTSNLPVVVSVSSASTALRITQTGTGNALVVEDSANPDATPFVVDASGQLTVGASVRSTIGTVTPNILVQNNSSGTANGIGVASWLASTAGSKVALGKSRSATIGTPAIVSSGDTLATLSFAGDDGAAFIDAASIIVAVDGTPGLNDMPGRLVFSTTGDGASTPTERMRIDNAGLVSIGTSSVSNQRLRVQYNVSDATATSGSILADGTHTLTANNALQYNNMESQAVLNQGAFNQTTSLASGGGVRGFRAFPTVSGASGTVTAAVGYASDVRNTGAGVLTNAVGFVAQGPQNTGGGTLTNAMGFYAAPTTSGTNNYGFYSDIASGTGRWNFYAAGTADNYFAGQVQLGAGTVSAPALSATGDTNTGIFFPAADTMAFAEGGAEVMRIDSSGNVGIGTTAAGSKLDVKGTLRLSGATSGYVGLAPAAAAGSTTYTLPAADGTSGQVLSTNGSGTLSWASSGGTGTLKNVQVFTSSGTYTRTAGVTTAVVIAVGGGGGGKGANGGIAGGNGGNGGTTSFGAHVTAAGGTGSTSSQGGAGGTGGTSATIAIPGQGGGAGLNAASAYFGGIGGGQGGGRSSALSVAGTAGSRGGGGSGGSGAACCSQFGGGGGGQGETGIKYTTTVGATETVTIGAGGTAGTGPSEPGGAGGAGYIIVYEYS